MAKTEKKKPESNYQPSELVIKEIMFQKNVSREEAIKILKNPTPHPESTSPKKLG